MESTDPLPEPAPRTERDRRVRWAAALLAVLTVGVYGRTFRHGFVIFDDPVYVYENEVVSRGLTAEGFRWAFGFHASNWHPLTWLSHMLDVELFGLDAGGHHAVGVALHALNALFFFLALRALARCDWAPLLAAALFALHPLRVESVAWASERKDVLSTTFWMLTLLAYAHYARRPGRGRLALVALSLAVGLTAKQMLVTLPCVLLLLDAWPLRRGALLGIGGIPVAGSDRARIWREKLPLFALVAAASATTFLAQRLQGAVVDLTPLSPVSRAANAIRSYAVYVVQSLWPVDLACFYAHPATPGMDTVRELWIPAAFALLFLALVSAAAWRLRRRAPWLAVGWLWYLGTAVPVIGLVQVGQQAHADRYTYVPALGLAITAAFGLRALVLARPRWKRGVVAAVLLVLAALSVGTWRQTRTWETSRSLFAHAAEVTGPNFYARTFHGNTLRVDGELDAAREELHRAIELHPGFSRSHWELGLVERDAGSHEAAVRHLKDAVHLDPDDPRKRNDLAVSLMSLERFEEAERQLRAGLRADPGHADCLVNLGGLAFNRRELGEAEEHYRAALASDPGHAKAWMELGRLCLFAGRKEEAREALERARALDPELEGLEELSRVGRE